MIKAEKRSSKEITNRDDIEFLINIKPEDICTSFVMETFAEFDGKRRFNPYDLFTVPEKIYTKSKDGTDENRLTNKKPFKTSVGRWIFNKYFIEPAPHISYLIGYVNDDLTKKTFGKIYDKLSYALIEDKIPLEEYKNYIMKGQQFMPFVSILCPSYSDAMLTVTEELNKRKAQLIKENKEALDNGDIYVVDKITKELLAYSTELLKDDPAMDVFNSGARGTFNNNFKNMYVMRGSVMDPDPTKGYNIITSNYMDGVSKEEYSKLANTLAAGPYARAKKTQGGGYLEKLFVSAFGHVVLLDKGTDCGTTRTIEIDVTNKNIKEIIYSNAVINGKLVEINSDNKDEFIGKKINIRFASMCEAKDGICNACAGNLFYKLGDVRNIGMLTQQIPSRLKVLQLKKFHDDQVDFIEVGKDIDPYKVFGLK